MTKIDFKPLAYNKTNRLVIFKQVFPKDYNFFINILMVNSQRVKSSTYLSSKTQKKQRIKLHANTISIIL